MPSKRNLIEKLHLPTYENRSFLKRALARYRMLTFEDRALPDFMIIGTQKGGTTSLYRYLAKHPQLKPNYVVKELSFFDELYGRGEDWYRSNFPKQQPGNLYFEGCTHYLFNPLAPERIKKHIPDVKVIALLRNPIERTFSSYKHQVRAGRENLSFEDAINAEAERLDGELEKMVNDPNYFSYNYNHFSYIERSKYDLQIENWLKHFPADNMLIFSSEEFFSDPSQTTQQCFDFLHVSPIAISHKKKHNTGNYTDQIAPETRAKLQSIFEPHNKNLYSILKRDFNWK